MGYITEDKPGRYRLGPAVAALLDQAPQQRMPQLLRPLLERLAAETGETALLGTRVGASVVYLEQVESSARIRYAAPLHQRRPLAGTSTGKTYLGGNDARAGEPPPQESSWITGRLTPEPWLPSWRGSGKRASPTTGARRSRG